MLEKLGGFVTIIAAVTGLTLISIFRLPVFVQIICAIAGSVVCLIGIVFLFSEGQIFDKRLSAKKAPKKVG